MKNDLTINVEMLKTIEDNLKKLKKSESIELIKYFIDIVRDGLESKLEYENILKRQELKNKDLTIFGKTFSRKNTPNTINLNAIKSIQVFPPDGKRKDYNIYMKKVDGGQIRLEIPPSSVKERPNFKKIFNDFWEEKLFKELPSNGCNFDRYEADHQGFYDNLAIQGELDKIEANNVQRFKEAEKKRKDEEDYKKWKENEEWLKSPEGQYKQLIWERDRREEYELEERLKDTKLYRVPAWMSRFR